MRKFFWVACGIYVCVLLCIFFILDMNVSTLLADNIEKEISEKKNNILFSDLLGKEQHNTSLICAVPRYYSLRNLKDKLPINNLNYYRLYLMDYFYEYEHRWWFVSLKNKDEIGLYRMPYKFRLDRNGFFCFTPDARLNYLGEDGVFLDLSVEE